MAAGRILIGLAGIGVLAVAFWYVRSNSADTTGDSNKTDAAIMQQMPGDTSVTENSIAIEPESSTELLAKPSECVGAGLEVIAEHPVFQAELRRIAPLVDAPDLTAYAGISITELESLAKSADGNAMVLLAVYEMRKIRGSRFSEASEVSNAAENLYLSPSTVLDARKTDHVDRASYWLYEAGRHGSLWALGSLQQIEYARFGGPIEQGMIAVDSDIAEEEIANIDFALSNFVIGEVISNLHVDLQDGLLNYFYERSKDRVSGSTVLESLSKDPAVQQLIVEKVEIIQRDMDATGMPAIRLPPPALDLEEALAAICGDDFEIPELQN